MAEEFEASEDLVEKAKSDRSRARNPFARLVLFFKQVIAEIGKVTRPTWAELRNMTFVVLAFVAVVMIVISILDGAFFWLVDFAFRPTTN